VEFVASEREVRRHRGSRQTGFVELLPVMEK
jgi:hypothetical protein